LDNLVSLAAEAVVEDPKLSQLIEEIKKIRSTETRANILIYTEYTTSQDAVVRFLKKSNCGDVITLKGMILKKTVKQLPNDFDLKTT